MMKTAYLGGLGPAFCLGLSVVVACGCQDANDGGVEIPLASDLTKDVAKDGALPSASGTGGFSVPETKEDQTREFDGQLRLQIPATWQDAEMTAMQRSVLLAKFELPSVDPLIEVSVSSAGGGIDANFERWQGQFPGAAPGQETIDFDRSTAEFIQLEGDYHPGFGKMNQTDWVLLGAAFPGDSTDFYLKVTGPKEQVMGIKDTIRELVKTAELIR